MYVSSQRHYFALLKCYVLNMTHADILKLKQKWAYITKIHVVRKDVGLIRNVGAMIAYYNYRK